MSLLGLALLGLGPMLITGLVQWHAERRLARARDRWPRGIAAAFMAGLADVRRREIRR